MDALWVRRQLVEDKIGTKRGRPTGAFYGSDSGSWEYSETYRFGRTSDWEAVMGLHSHNQWRTLAVEGATEHHEGFRKAAREMARKYPELLDFDIKFDGPFVSFRSLLGTEKFDWGRTRFFHGTSEWAAERILKEGLRPRSETNAKPAYGVRAVGAGRVDAIYLTTQMNMAKFAAHDAAAAHKSTQVVLEIRGVDPKYVLADEDSGETDPKKSLDRIGSIAYAHSVPPKSIRVVARYVGRQWV